MRRAVLLLSAAAQLCAGIDLLYLPNHACDAKLLPKEAKRKMPSVLRGQLARLGSLRLPQA